MNRNGDDLSHKIWPKISGINLAKKVAAIFKDVDTDL